MRHLILASLTALFFSASAQAQLGDILKNKDKIFKGAKVAHAVTAEFTPAQELEIGKVIAGKVLYNYHLSKNSRLQDYVTLVGQTLVPYSSRANQDWHFAVIETDVVNAFSTPGNFVFVSTGALRQMKSEAELANVLGHEIAHVSQKHILNEVKKGNVFSAGLELATDGHGGLSDELGKKVADLAWQKLITKGLGRHEELEADAIGSKLAASAGYQSEAMISFLNTLDQLFQKHASGIAVLANTHPDPKVRIEALKPNVSSSGVVLDARFKKWMAGK